MTQIISDLRVLTEAGTADWTLGTATFWDDDQMQDVLDKHRTEFVFEPMQDFPTYGTTGDLVYNDYRADFNNIEATTGGTAVFFIQDSSYAVAGTALYTADYRRGKFTFVADTEGESHYVTGRSYDLNNAAAEIWRIKANHYATSFDFSTDNTTVKKSQVYQHCLERAEYFEGLSTSAVTQAIIYRSDDAVQF
jgi:hypothetical protein